MYFFRTWQLGVKSLLLHPMRSLLTVLGIFIGVASVIWLLAIGEGISEEAQKQLAGLGANNIIIRTVKPPNEVLANASQSRAPVPYGLTRSEYDLLFNTIPHVTSAVPIRELRRQFRYGDKQIDGRLVGCTPEYAEITQLKVDRGHFITDADLRHNSNKCVLAAHVAEELFGYEDPIGRSVYLSEHKNFYEVVGILYHRDPTAAIGGSLSAQDFSNDIYVPITTIKKRIGDTIVTRASGAFMVEIVELSQITLRIDDIKNVPRTAKVVEDTLGVEDPLTKHGKMQDVAVVVPKDLLDQAKRTKMMFMVLMGLIAAISLLVGGIGIMNIMLATVTERTREIGVRRALGARKDDIIRQFLVETTALSVVGGLAGVLGGFACLPVVRLARYFLESYASQMMASLPEVARTVEPIIVPLSIPLAFGISVLVGVVFGIYPAIRAANMDPIEALRHE